MKNFKLKAAVIEKGYRFEEFAKLINMTKFKLSRKINGHTEFTESEIEIICNVLQKQPTELFFTHNVAKTATKDTA